MLYQSLWMLSIIVLGGGLFIFVSDPNIRGNTIWAKEILTFFLFFYVLLTAVGIGRKLKNWLQGLSKLEFYVLSLILGLSILSNGMTALGLLGILTPTMIFGWLALCGLVASFQWREIIEDFLKWTKSIRRIKFNGLGGFEYIFLFAAAPLALALPLISLAPVRDYDALMYHLQIPRQFLEHGGIYFDPQVWRLSQPMLTEMIFLIGIVFQLEPFSQLISLAYCGAFFLSTYAFGRRFFDSKVAFLAVGILMGNPAFPLYATSPGVEFSWASYEFWSLYLVSIWLFSEQSQKRNLWLFFAGVMAGLAATTKYLSFPIIPILGIIILWKTIRLEKSNYKKIVKNVLLFGIPALVVILPWYLKSFFWTGNPFYPLVFGGPGWTPLRQELIVHDYVGSFGTGTTWLDYLTIPINMYLAQPRFSIFPLEIFHPLLWLGFAIPFIGNWRRHDHLFIYIALGFALWATNMRQIRFLLPLSGCLALLSAEMISRFPRLIKLILSTAFVGGLMLVTTLSYQLSIIRNPMFLDYLTGNISESEFLQGTIYSFTATQFIQENLKETERALFLWLGYAYYCDERCQPDGDHSIAVQLSINSPAPETLARQLRSMGITHIFLGRPDAYWFIKYHDPNHYHRNALNYFETIFLPACADLILENENLGLYLITCE